MSHDIDAEGKPALDPPAIQPANEPQIVTPQQLLDNILSEAMQVARALGVPLTVIDHTSKAFRIRSTIPEEHMGLALEKARDVWKTHRNQPKAHGS